MLGDGLRFTRTSPVAIVGAGRLGSSLALALKRAGFRLVAVSSRDSSHRQWLRSRLPGVSIADSPREAAKAAEIIFITVADGSVSAVASAIDWAPSKAAIHCAGALPVSALDVAARAGAAIAGFHPLQTFPTTDGMGRFKGIGIGIETSDRSLGTWLRGAAENLGGRPFELTSSQREAYHASAVMACGLLAGLAGLAAEMWQELGVSRQQALANLSPLIQSTADAIAEYGIPAALTGPYVRGDVETVNKHLAATSRRSPATEAAYSALALAAMPLMAEQGGLDSDARAEIERALRRSLDASCEKLGLTT